MFFRERSTQAEYFDAPERSATERLAAFRELDRINQFFRFDHPFVSRLPSWLGEARCASLEILDVGAGTGLLGRVLSDWAGRRGWDWRFTNLDLNPLPLPRADRARIVAGSALALPFTDGRFDLVVASQMTHHLTDEEVVRHWREAWRVTRDAMFICDLHRNAGFYALLGPALRLLGVGSHLRQDGMISVRRGFRRREWLELAARAEIPAPQVWVYYGTRIGLQARKGGR
jgi:2-polyprenyl-3-methyl-5-hydroxy-6-metoxy-1,4-benzoquinol methylase